MRPVRCTDRLHSAKRSPGAIAVACALSLLPIAVFAEELPDCAEAFGASSLGVHDGEQGNLNLRDGSRVFETTGVNANAGGGSSLNQQGGTACIADDDPTDPSPGACDTFGAVTSWEEEGRDFPEPPSDSYPGTQNLTVGAGETETITTTEGDPVHFRRITIEDGGHLIVEGDGELTVRQRFTGEPGATLEINGTPVINIDDRFLFGGRDTRSFINVDTGGAAGTSDTFAQRLDFENTTLRISEGTWRPMTLDGGGNIDVSDSDMNCDPTHEPGDGWQPTDVMPRCQTDSGGMFMISRSGGSIEDSAVRHFIYIDGQQFNVDRSLIQGSLTSGGNTMRQSDFVSDAIPNTGEFCEEKVREFTFDLGAGDASTCRRREIGITPRDRFGQALTTFTSTVDIEVSSNHGDWFRLDEDGNPGDPGAVNTPFNTGNNDGFGNYTFDADDLGDISLFLENIHADDLRITVTTDSQVPEGETEISSTSGLLSFRDNVFVIESVDSLGDDVVAGRDHLFEAALWRRDGDAADAEECAVPATYNATGQAARMWITRHGDDPDGTAPRAVALGTGSDATLGNADPGSPNIELDFSGANSSGAGRARFRLETTDVGKYGFALAEQNSGFAVDEAGDPRPITGGSDDYVVRPFAFDVQVSGTNPAAQGPGGDVFLAAGEAFNLTVRAVRYLAAADPSGDGHPDHYTGIDDDSPENRVDLAAADPTPSFGQEGTPGTAGLAAVLWQPTGGRDPGLSGAPDPVPGTGFTNGVAEVENVHYDEVGIVVLNAFNADYLGSGHQIRGGTRDSVGRFIPAEFRLERMGAGDEIDHRAELASCTSEFTYMGEPFDAIFTLRAFSLQDNVTENYEDDFAFLDVTDEEAFEAAGYADGTELVDDLQALDADGEWTAGEAVEIALRLQVERDCNGGDCPKDSYEALHIGIDPEDDDGVGFTAFDLPVNDDEEHAEVGIADVRFGRLVLDNAAGSELGSIDLRMAAEYWDGTNWALNTDDACTVIAIDAGDELRLEADGGDTDDGTGTVTLAGGGETGLAQDTAVMLDDGVAVFTLTAPGAGNTGWAEITLDLADRWPHLRDEGDDGDWDASPVGRATFGLHQGADGRIYVQETQPQ